MPRKELEPIDDGGMVTVCLDLLPLLAWPFHEPDEPKN